MRAHLATVTLLAAALALGGCGDDDDGGRDTEGDGGSASATTTPAELAAGADDIVVSVAVEGGFIPFAAQFSRVPTVLVTGDGRVLSAGPEPAGGPPPLVPTVEQRTITDAGTRSLLAQADELGLVADVTYSRDDLLADAPDTVVTITVGGRTYGHRADALGIDTRDDPARAALAEFVAAAGDLGATVGAGELGPVEPYVADDYLIRALPIVEDGSTVDPSTVVDWPSDAPVRLAEAAECATVPGSLAAALFADATVLTLFADDGVTYEVAAVPELPGRTCR